MKMIRMRFAGPTDTRGARWIADDGDNRMIRSFDCASEDGADGRLSLAQEFAEKFWRLRGRKIEYKGSWKEEQYYGIKEEAV